MHRSDLLVDVGADRCHAWVYRPEGDGPHPAVVMAHGLGGTKAMGLEPYAERFAEAGFVCLLFDYRCWGASTGTPRRLISVGRQREDWAAAVRAARALPDVDPDRVAVWGTSFSGGHAIATAARDPRVAAVVAQGPFTDGIASGLRLHPVTALRVGLRAVADLAGAARGKEPRRVAIAGAPRSATLMAAPDAASGYAALRDPDDHEPADTPARIGLAILTARPGRAARHVTAPLHVDVCATDSVAPARATLRHLRRAPTAEVHTHDVGHFDVYHGAVRERLLDGQLAFLRRHLGPATPDDR